MKGRTILEINNEDFMQWAHEFISVEQRGCRTCKYFENKRGRVRCMLPLPNEKCELWAAKDAR